MRFSLGLLALVLFPNFALTQTKTCTASPATVIDDRDGVTAKTVSFQTSSRELTAHVFLPDRSDSVPGFAFSHSSIQYPGSRTDLLQFARALARGGSAVIMLDNAIDWQTTLDNTKIKAKDVACAAHWLLSNVKLDPERLSVGGPMKEFVNHVTPFCPDAGKQPCSQVSFYVYWEVSHEDNYIKLMKTREGQLKMIRNIPEQFGLKDIKLDWL